MAWEQQFDSMAVPDDRERTGEKATIEHLGSVLLVLISFSFILLYIISLILETTMDSQNFE